MKTNEQQCREVIGMEIGHDRIWVGVLRPNSHKVDDVFFSVEYASELTAELRERNLRRTTQLVTAWNARTPAPVSEDVVERVADAIMCAYLGSKKMPEYKTDEVRKSEQYSQCCMYAQAALTAINIPAIRAQARKEALEEAVSVINAHAELNEAHSIAAYAIFRKIRKLIEKEG